MEEYSVIEISGQITLRKKRVIIKNKGLLGFMAIILGIGIVILSISCQKQIILSENEELLIGSWHMIADSVRLHDSTNYQNTYIYGILTEFRRDKTCTFTYYGSVDRNSIPYTTSYKTHGNILSILDGDVVTSSEIIFQNHFLILIDYGTEDRYKKYIRVNK